MYLKSALLLVVLFLVASISFGIVDPNTGSKEKVLNRVNYKIELFVSEDDSLETKEVIQEPKKKEKKEKEEDTISILSVNMIFEIIYHFNLRDLLNLPSK